MNTISPGIHPDLDIDEYHADAAIGSSVLKDFYKECPLYCHAMHVAKTVEKLSTPSTTFGSHSHLNILEQDKFKEQFMIAPEMGVVNKGKENERAVSLNKNMVDFKEFAKQAKQQNKEALLCSEYKEFQEMARQIEIRPHVKNKLIGGIAEMSFFAIDPETGLLLKARPDYLVEIGGELYLIDYKTTSVSLRTYKQSGDALYTWSREIQGAFHKHVIELAFEAIGKPRKIAHIIYVTQKTKSPFFARNFRLPDYAIEGGDAIRRAMLLRFKKCKDDNVWPDYPEWEAELHSIENDEEIVQLNQDYIITGTAKENEWQRAEELIETLTYGDDNE